MTEHELAPFENQLLAERLGGEQALYVWDELHAHLMKIQQVVVVADLRITKEQVVRLERGIEELFQSGRWHLGADGNHQ